MTMFFKKKLSSQEQCQQHLLKLPSVAVSADDYEILEAPSYFHQRLLALIGQARHRIMMTVLYLQDDQSGREVLEALYAAKERNPHLHIRVYVDFHRAQRGLIGKAPSQGNSELYYRMAAEHLSCPAIYGVPVKKREIFGVMHLKGCVFDDTVLYSGASINDVYLGVNGRYRLDRYHEIKCQALADSLCNYATAAFHENFAVQDFSQGQVRSAREIRDEIKQLRRHLAVEQYHVNSVAKPGPGEVAIAPVAGLGRRDNQLNQHILYFLGAAREKLFVCTPYFNLPKPVLAELQSALSRKVKITLAVGDKTANDFYIPPEEPFSTIGAIPYIYEQNLREFMQHNEQQLKNGQLEIWLWRDGRNTYHVKGMFADQQFALITGNNLNPRAWGLDLENGLFIHDPQHLLQEKFMHEQLYLLRHAQKLTAAQDLESFESYPEEVRKILTKVKRFKASVFIKQLL